MQSDPNPYSPPDASLRSGLPFTDMRPLLTVMGILSILGGVSCACLGGFYGLFFPFAMTQEGGSPEMEELRQQMGLGAGMNGVMLGFGLMLLFMAIGLIWLGIGSIRARKWARDLHFSLGWLIAGVVAASALGYAFFIPSMLSAMQPPPGTGTGSGSPMGAGFNVIMIVSLIVGFGMYLAPAVFLIIVYGLKNVRLTVQHFDQSSPWTDRVAIPVQIWWLLLVWMAVSLVAMAPTYGPFIVNVGLAGTTFEAAAAMAITALLCGAVARGIMTRRSWGWLGSMALALLFLGLGAYSYVTADLGNAYKEMGMPEEQIDMMRQMYGENLGAIWLPMGMLGLASLIYLLVVRRHWHERLPGPQPAADAP